MNTSQIDRLIANRNKLTDRRDGLTDSKRVRNIDAQLSQVPAGADNRVDLLLGRACAVLPPHYMLTPREISVTQAEQYRIEAEGLPDGRIDHDDWLAGAP